VLKRAYYISTLLFLLCQLAIACTIFSTQPNQLKRRDHLIYTWKRGDKLQDIADDFNQSLIMILRFNGIKNASSIKVGQKIKIPFPQAVSQDAKLGSERSIKEINPLVAKKYYGKIKLPLSNYRVSSNFGKRRGGFHEGIDLAAKEGSKIFAAHSGVVIYSDNELSGYGNLIIIRGDQLLTIYAHNKKNLVTTGDLIKSGQVIALVGKTGRASAPHLHFETRILGKNGQYSAVNPKLFGVPF
jgi:hypothetical protein